jgi:hypothetical protein
LLLADETLDNTAETQSQSAQPQSSEPQQQGASAAAADSIAAGSNTEEDAELEAMLTAEAAAAAAAAAASISPAQKGSLEEAVRLMKLGAGLPVDRATIEVLSDAAAAAVAWQKRVLELLPGPKGVPARRGVEVAEVIGLIREGQGLPFR